MAADYTPKRDEPVFWRDGDLLVPSVLARGPWYEGSLHGSAMLAVMARAAEQHHSEVPRQVVRLTVDMMRAAPLKPLRVETATVRAGKNIDFVDLALYAEDQLWVRGTALRMRLSDLEVATDGEPDLAPTPPSIEQAGAPPFVRPGADEPAFHHAIDFHIDPANQMVWFRVAVPLVEGEENNGLVTVAAVADWTYAVPSLLRTAGNNSVFDEDQTTVAINADTTINTVRPTVGPWLGMRGSFRMGSLGAGTASGELFDAAGAFGSSSQSVLVRGVSGAPLAVKEVSG